jgi:cytochrome c oxidase subunit 2
MALRIMLLAVLGATVGCAGGTGGAASSAPRSTSVGSVAAGKVVFGQAGCGNCHTLVAAGTGGTTGPNLTTQAPMDATRAGVGFPAFVRQSIVDPNAYIAKGFHADIMPPSFAAQLSSAQISDLVALITKRR